MLTTYQSHFMSMKAKPFRTVRNTGESIKQALGKKITLILWPYSNDTKDRQERMKDAYKAPQTESETEVKKGLSKNRRNTEAKKRPVPPFFLHFTCLFCDSAFTPLQLKLITCCTFFTPVEGRGHATVLLLPFMIELKTEC